MFIFYFVYTKRQVLLICNENEEICVANLMIEWSFFFLFRIILGGIRPEWIKETRFISFYWLWLPSRYFGINTDSGEAHGRDGETSPSKEEYKAVGMEDPGQVDEEAREAVIPLASEVDV